MYGQGKTPFCHRSMIAYSVGIAPHILNFSTWWSTSYPQLLYPLPPVPIGQKDGWATHLDWMFWRQITCPCQDVESRSSSLYPLYYTDNATQTPTLSPFIRDFNLICVPCNMAHISSAFRKVWWELVWYFSLLRNLGNVLMENKIVNPVLHKNDTLWNTSK